MVKRARMMTVRDDVFEAGMKQLIINSWYCLWHAYASKFLLTTTAVQSSGNMMSR